MYQQLVHPRSPLTAPALLALILFAWLGSHAAEAQAGVPVEWTERVLALDQRVYAVEREAQPQGDTGFAIFVGSQRNELRLRRVKLRVGDLPPVEYDYSEAEWDALAAGGLHPAWTGTLAPGEHRLQLELHARGVDATRNDTPIVHRIDQRINVQPGASLELSLAQRRFGGSELELIAWTDTGAQIPASIPVDHPWLRAGQFWIAAQRPYASARMFRRLQLHNPGAPWAAQANSLAATAVHTLAQPGPGISTAELAAVEQLNAALATLASGNAQPLQHYAAQEALSETARVRRDHAHLALGYDALGRGDGEAARGFLALVRSPGPSGNQGLLGFGWSFVQAGPGADAAPTAAPPDTRVELATAAGQPAFVKAAHAPRQRFSEERREALRRALVPWTELVGRDPLDAAAQEGALALAWALDELGTGTQAHVYYERAASMLEIARAQAQQAMGHVRSGALADAVGAGTRDPANGWRPWLSDLLHADGTRYLLHLLQEPRFVEALDDYRSPRLLHDELLDCQRRLQAVGANAFGANAAAANPARTVALDADLRDAINRSAALEGAARMQLQNTALTLLQAWNLRTERYLAEARLALARHFDFGLEPEIDVRREPTAERAS